MDASELTPEHIRALRGDESRAAFARRLEVTPHAVYRWELPRGAKEARSPRGRERRLLEAMRAGHTDPAPARSEPRGAESSSRRATVHALFSAEHAEVHARMLHEIGAEALEPDERALYAAALAVHAALHHFDAERTLLALGPALSWARERSGVPEIVAWVRVAEACAHSLPDLRYFDPKRVAHLATQHDDEPCCMLLAACALISTGSLTSDDSLSERGFQLLARVDRAALPELLAAHFDELDAFRMLFHGESGSARALLQRAVDASAKLACPPLSARVLASLAMRQLDDLSDPDAALELALRSRREAERARLGAGLHEAFYVRAEIEAHARRGDLPAALAQIESYDQRSATTPHVAFPALAACARLLLLAGRYDELEARAGRLRASCNVVAAEAADAHATFMEALARYGRGDTVADMIGAFERAEAKAVRSELLRRDVLLYGTGAVLAQGSMDLTLQWLRRTQRQLDRMPTSWSIAQLRRLEGLIAAAQGDWPRARALLQTALAAFGVAADRVGAALVRWLYVTLAAAHHEPEVSAAEVQRAAAEIDALGVKMPVTMQRGVANHCAHHAARTNPSAAQPHAWASRLLVPVARLTVRGVEHALVLRELLAVLHELFNPRCFRLEVIDATGRAPHIDAELASVEFGDGSGTRRRIVASSPMDEEERAAMAVLAAVASLALESSASRSFGTSLVQRDEPEIMGDFVAASPALRALRRDVITLAPSSATVVIGGESGTGKEVIARALHDASPRAAAPFVAFNCATVPRELFEGQLFGHKRGAFTGAVNDRIGVLRAAQGGTLFLDEIAELPLDVQPKLLRFLENHEVTPLGGTRALRVDVRVVAATHQDLAALVRAGSFREDLFFRLQVVKLRVPPLRERREDIVPLARHFLSQLTPGRRVELSPAAIQRLHAYDFPGNVRELRNLVERSLAYAPSASVLDVVID